MNCNVKITAVGTADGLEVSIHGGSVGMMTAAELIVARVLMAVADDEENLAGLKDSMFEIINEMVKDCWAEKTAKVGQYRDKGNGEYEYFDAGLVGHGEGSVIMAQQYIKLTAREIVAIRWHMGAYSGKQDWGTLSAVYDRYPEALCLHFADMIATHYDEVPF